MARIPDAELERLKSEVSLERLAEAHGVTFTRHGADLIGRCPFHEDKTPSLVITPGKNLWHCLGACQAGGTVIDWVMRAEGISFRHAVELLQNDYRPLAASSAARGAPPARHSTVRHLTGAFERDIEDGRLLKQVIEYYHQTLLQSPEALRYLERRGIGSSDAISTLRLGYANRTLGYRVPMSNRMEGAAVRGQLQRIGLIRGSGHEHFNGSIVIPVINEVGEIGEVYGRKIHDNLREGTPKHLYLPGPHRGVWNEVALAAEKEVILCEALIDALSFWCAGYRNVTASYGVQGFTEDHLSAFKRYGIERVLMAYDADAAGNEAAGELARRLLAAGFDCYRIVFPKGMDANEYALKVGPPAKSLGVAIRSAQWLGRGAAKPVTTVPAGLELERRPQAARPTLEGEEARAGKGLTEETAAEEPSRRAVEEVAAPVKNTASETPALAAAPAETPAVPRALPAQVIPPPPAPVMRPQMQRLGSEREYSLTLGERRYRVRGLEKNSSYETLKVNLLASRLGLDGLSEAVHVDTLDLYQARSRATFLHQAGIELGLSEEILKADLGKLLLALEAEQAERLEAPPLRAPPAQAAMLEAEREEALGLLRDPHLTDRIVQDFARCGIVGERTNALVSYLAAISRKLERPLALLIQSSSAAGKSSLLDAMLRLVPEEERIVYSAMTGQSLFYMGERDLKHKLLAIAEGEGMERASYALKLLQSEGELTIASTSKDATTGKLSTETYHVEGPVMIALTTTAAAVDEELLSRCLVLSIDEGRRQTQAIQAAQRERRTLAGLEARCEREGVVKLHQNAQRLLEPLAIVNPYASQLTFLDDRTRLRRDHEKYLTLIDSIALLHQHQRPVRESCQGERTVRYIEVTLGDIALANALAHEVLGRTLDELPPQTRRLLSLIVERVEEDCRAQHIRRAQHRFSRRALRQAIRWGDTQLKIHLARLVELEYLLVHRGGRGQSFEYELLFDGAASAATPHVSGLIDVEALRSYDATRSAGHAERSVSGRPSVEGPSVGSRELSSDEKPKVESRLPPSESSAAAQVAFRARAENSAALPQPAR
ncbi:MAG: toprim domain-containing protein [Steroidobacteraceae bacterium]